MTVSLYQQVYHALNPFLVSFADQLAETKVYIRPTNGRAEDQLRRNRSTQYFSYPDFKFDRLREESPGKYESYADMGLSELISMKIEVKDEKAKLYLNESENPVLIVNDLKHGANTSGGIGF